ncbi:MAG: DUF3316 domain-containing protein [Bacteroidaceae bacterium]|nr:DUF3316 domain-containing protein [Bacteroidaceae bacterium]
MRKFYLLFALCFAVFVSQAQETVANGVKENQPEEEVSKSPITFKISYHLGSSTIANHYMSANAYKGVASGIHVDLGRFYKRWENISWNLSFDNYSAFKAAGGLENAAKTSSMSYKALDLNYSSFYNWKFGKGLMVKVGGGVDISGDLITNLTHQMNNAASMNVLAQLEASAGICYTFKFKKWMLGLSGDISTPFAGLIMTDARHESGVGSFTKKDLMGYYFSHIKGTSFSNLQGVDFDFGIKFITPKVAIVLDIVTENRWWYVNEIQNIRKNAMFQIGASFNIANLKQTKTVQRYF